MRKLWILVLLLAPGSLLTASGQEFAFAQRARQENVQDVNYQRGQSALDAHRWDQALAAFNQAVEAAGPRTDAALYWKAYSLEKLGRRGDALATLAQLRQAYASSKWLDDARALELEMRQASGQKVNPDAEPDEDLKLMAINGLLNTDPARALPVLEKLISSSGSPKLKERALFVLAQSGAPQSKEILGRIARGGSNPDLQLKAVNFLGVMGSPENRKLLAEIYTSSSDMKVKRAVLQAYLVSGDRQRLLELAKGEKDPALRMDAIHHLGVSGGQSELWQLYQAEPSIDVKEKILKSMFVGGNSEKLLEVARNEKDARLRRAAIQSLGLMGPRTGDALVGIYASEQDKEIRRAILNGLFIQGNAKSLVSLARKETDPQAKREIVQKLSMMGGADSTNYLMELLK